MSNSHSTENPSELDTKSSWIATHGSSELQSIYNAGYSSDEAYAIERIKFDYPGFQVAPSFGYDRADSPHAYIFAATLEYPKSYCYSWVNTTGIAIDNYLGKHQIFKRIEIPTPTKEESESSDFNDTEYSITAFVKTHVSDKEEWILTCGSDELRQAYLNGYECEIGYTKDRLSHDYPGFEISPYQHDRTDTPSKRGLNACLQYQYANAYVCTWGGDEYIFIPNYLRSHPIWQKVDEAVTAELDLQSTVYEVTNQQQHTANSVCKVIAAMTTVAIPLLFWAMEFQVPSPIPSVSNTSIPFVSSDYSNSSELLIK